MSPSVALVFSNSCQFWVPVDCCQKAMSERWLLSFPLRWAAALDQRNRSGESTGLTHTPVRQVEEEIQSDGAQRRPRPLAHALPRCGG